MVGGHVEPEPYYTYWTTPFNLEPCQCQACANDNCIAGYVYNCEWDNFHYHQRCRPIAGEIEWINKDFRNTTGEERNDLHWWFERAIGHRIMEVSTPPELPHLEIGASGSTTALGWSQGVVPNREDVHAGVKINWGDEAPPHRFAHSSRWSLDGVVEERVAGCASIQVDELADPIAITVANTADPGDPWLVVDAVSYALLEAPVELSELRWNNPAIPWVPTTYGALVPPAGRAHLGPIPGAVGDFLIVQCAVNFAADPDRNAGHLIVQTRIE